MGLEQRRPESALLGRVVLRIAIPPQTTQPNLQPASPARPPARALHTAISQSRVGKGGAAREGAHLRQGVVLGFSESHCVAICCTVQGKGEVRLLDLFVLQRLILLLRSCGVSNWTLTFGDAADSRTVTLDGYLPAFAHEPCARPLAHQKPRP